MKPHVSGVGLLGSFLVNELHHRGIEFTWSDSETAFSAWRASTGAVIPCEDGDTEPSAFGYRFWRDGFQARSYIKPHLEQVETIYVMKNPPARVTRRWKPDLIGPNRVWREPLPGWQFDVESFVAAARARFAARRISEAEPGQLVVRARGVMETRIRPVVVWGWRVPATIEPQDDRMWSRSGLRPVFHFNDPERTFERFYFYPRATHSAIWWCGSESVLQRAPEFADERARAGFLKYQWTVQERFRDLLNVRYDASQLTQGWRAKPRVAHKALLGAPWRWCFEASMSELVTMPLYKSGVQCGPWAASEIADVIEGKMGR